MGTQYTKKSVHDPREMFIRKTMQGTFKVVCAKHLHQYPSRNVTLVQSTHMTYFENSPILQSINRIWYCYAIIQHAVAMHID